MDLCFRTLALTEAARAVDIINRAAQWYASFLPPEELHVPEMTVDQWREEGTRMTWHGAYQGEQLLAVMGLEPKLDVYLIRHAYVDPAHQRRGIGSSLLKQVEARAPRHARLIAGTYQRNFQARALFERHGFQLSRDAEAVLRKYYAIPEDRLRTSLTLEKFTAD